MGIVLPFVPRAKKQMIAALGSAYNIDSGISEDDLLEAMRDGRDRRGILAAATPLIVQCRDLYGFTVMRTGLPEEPEVLATAVLTLVRSLALLDTEFGGRWPYCTYGVYFGHAELAWFEDGYGDTTGLAVPIGTDAKVLAGFIQHRIRISKH